MSLTDANIRSASATDKPRKLYDADGLYLLVQPSGSKLWRFKYRYNGVEKLISLGSYPEVSLKEARSKRDASRATVQKGDDPSRIRQEERVRLSDSFGEVAREHLAEQAKRLGPSTLHKTQWFLDEFLLPDLGSRPISDIEAPELLRVLRKIESRGLTDSVFRSRSLAGRIFRFGIATGRCSRDPSADLRNAIARTPVTHHAAITDPKKVGELLRSIDAYRGQPSTVYALRLLPLVFLRSAELRGARWEEVDFETQTWRIPKARMKMSEEHIVPLSRQSLAILRSLHAHSGHTALLFPGLVSNLESVAESTLSAALRRMDYSIEEQTIHGFRTIASTLLNEMGVPPDLIELQLAHKERNSVRSAYNRATRLQERREMMQRWADHLDTLKA